MLRFRTAILTAALVSAAAIASAPAMAETVDESELFSNTVHIPAAAAMTDSAKRVAVNAVIEHQCANGIVTPESGQHPNLMACRRDSRAINSQKFGIDLDASN